MTQRKNYLTISSLLLATSVLGGCALFSPQEKIVTVPQIVEKDIPLADRPKGLSLADVEFFVVTAENYDEFESRFTDENGQLVFVAMSVRGYEAMSLNMAELRRYILQQKEVIIYYEKSLEKNTKKDTQ